MAINIAAWNLRGNLSDFEMTSKLTNEIIKFDSDIVVLSDAYSTAEMPEKATAKFAAEGYEGIFGVPYEETGEREEHQSDTYNSLLVLSRLALEKADVVRLGVRNGFRLGIVDPDTDVFVQGIGSHFDDRNEVNRIKQVQAVTNALNLEQPAFVAGDLNAMHGDARISRLLTHPLANRGIKAIPFTWQRIVASRLNEMASGNTLRMFEAAGLRDADISHKPTMPNRLPLFQLDHLLTTNDIMVSDFTVHSRTAYSDHRAISAKLHT